jgi:hypothetical protein
MSTDVTFRPNRLPWVPVSTKTPPPRSESTVITVFFDELWLVDKVPWTIRVSPYGSVYCNLQQSYESDSGTWYNLRVGDTQSVSFDDCGDFDLYSLFCGVEAYARRIWSAYSRNSGDLKQTSGHKLISSRAVSMAGHLRHLVPAYEQDSLEAKAKDEVIHFESVILAEEHGRLNRLRVAIQAPRRLGWSVCKTWHQKRSLASRMPYWHTFFSCFCNAFGIDSVARV